MSCRKAQWHGKTQGLERKSGSPKTLFVPRNMPPDASDLRFGRHFIQIASQQHCHTLHTWSFHWIIVPSFLDQRTRKWGPMTINYGPFLSSYDTIKVVAARVSFKGCLQRKHLPDQESKGLRSENAHACLPNSPLTQTYQQAEAPAPR